MTDLWTKLSLAVSIDSLGDGPSLHNWETELANQSFFPKLERLDATLKPLPKKSRFIENRPHLKTSTKDKPNWVEIISNLRPDKLGFAKALLQSSKTDIRKKEATENYLWPEPSTTETANSRLNFIIARLGGRPTGRQAIYKKVVLATEVPSHFPAPTTKINPKDEARTNLLVPAFQAGFKKFLTAPTRFPEPEFMAALRELQNLHTPAARAALEAARAEYKAHNQGVAEIKPISHHELKKLLFPIVFELNPQSFYDQVLPQDDIPDTLRITTIEKLCEATPDNNQIARHITQLKDWGKAKPILSSTPFSAAPAIQQALQKTFLDTEDTLNRDTILANLEGKPISLTKGYGERKHTLLHVCAWWKTEASAKKACQAYQKAKLSISPANKVGDTPCHYINNANAEVLLAAGANVTNKNKEGELPEDNCKYDARDTIETARKKQITRKVTRKLLASQTDLQL